MGIETAALVLMTAATGYSAYQSSQSAGDARTAARKQEQKAGLLQDEEKRNRLQAVMRAQKQRGNISEPSGIRSQIGSQGVGQIDGGKTLLGL